MQFYSTIALYFLPEAASDSHPLDSWGLTRTPHHHATSSRALSTSSLSGPNACTFTWLVLREKHPTPFTHGTMCVVCKREGSGMGCIFQTILFLKVSISKLSSPLQFNPCDVWEGKKTRIINPIFIVSSASPWRWRWSHFGIQMQLTPIVLRFQPF